MTQHKMDWIDTVLSVLFLLASAIPAMLIAIAFGAKPSEPPKGQGTVIPVVSKFGVQSFIQTKPD